MAAIVLQFSTLGTIGSWAIRVFQHGWATHVDAVLEDGRLLGARRVGGVAIRPADYAKFLRTVRLELPASDTVAKAYLAFLTAQLGKPYDQTAIVAFALNRDWREPDSWFCSEIICAALEASGFIPPLEAPAQRVTPEMLMFLCSAFARR